MPWTFTDQSRLPGFGERPLSIRAVCERFKGKNITFGVTAEKALR